MLKALPTHPNLPSLWATYDDGDGVALLLADIDAPLIELRWRPGQFDHISRALVEVHEVSTPNPWAGANVRTHNLMVDDQRVVVVNWGQARLSAPWADHAPSKRWSRSLEPVLDHLLVAAT